MEKFVDETLHAPHGAAQSHTVQFLTVAFVNKLPSPSGAYHHLTLQWPKKMTTTAKGPRFLKMVFSFCQKK